MLAPGKAAHGKASVRELQIPDGGGLGSTAVWLKPQENVDVLKPLRRCFMDLAKEWGLIPRLLEYCRAKRDDALLSSFEVDTLQRHIQAFLPDLGEICSLAIKQHQPFLLDIWRALSSSLRDADIGLPQVLCDGVPTGIVNPIQPSGVWEECSMEEEDQALDLLVHLEPWQSGLEDVEFCGCRSCFHLGRG
jgi:hypothetical protein